MNDMKGILWQTANKNCDFFAGRLDAWTKIEFRSLTKYLHALRMAVQVASTLKL